MNARDVKYDDDCISGLAFVRGTLFDPASVVYRDVTQQAKGLYRLKYVGALRSGLAYLSRCNLGWFCHRFFSPPTFTSQYRFDFEKTYVV
jgi:hypothetical protein